MSKPGSGPRRWWNWYGTVPPVESDPYVETSQTPAPGAVPRTLEDTVGMVATCLDLHVDIVEILDESTEGSVVGVGVGVDA